MEFTSLGKTGSGSVKTAKKDLPINLAVRLERVEISNDKPSLFHGFRMDTNEPVSVRMMTVDEGVFINKRKAETSEECKARLHKQYIGTGEAHRPRPAEVANASDKRHCEAGGLLMFTKAVKNEDGTFRAHWVDTIERTAGAGCDKVMAHIRVEDIRDEKDRTKIIGVQVVADVVRPDDAVVVNNANLVEVLQSAFDNKNANDEKRKPFIFVRLIDVSNGKIVLPPARGSAKYNAIERRDPDTGEEFTLREAAVSGDSIVNLISAENKSQDGMIIRAALMGLTKDPEYPEYPVGTSDDMIKELNMITDAVRSGALSVEIVPGERIGAGPATRASIEKAAKTQPNNPINTLYTVRNENGRTMERRFCETYLTTLVGKDGHRLFTKAVPVDCFPQARPMKSMATVNDHRAAAAEAQERSADAGATHVEVPETMPFDPSALDGKGHDEVNEKLLASAAALEVEM